MTVVVQQLQQKWVFYPINTNDIFLGGIQDLDTGLFWNNATLTATLYDEFSNVVTGASGISLLYQAGSNGDYLGTIPGSTFNPVPGGGYTLVIDGSQGSVPLHLEIPVEVRVRTS